MWLGGAPHVTLKIDQHFFLQRSLVYRVLLLVLQCCRQDISTVAVSGTAVSCLLTQGGEVGQAMYASIRE